MSCDCGIKPFLFGGWCQSACLRHDNFYINSAHSELTRLYVDKLFLSDCLELAKKGRCEFLKRQASYVMYGIVRATGGIFWDGIE